jgi:MFS family permease
MSVKQQTIRTGKTYLRRLIGLNYGDAETLHTEQRRSLRHMYLNGFFANFSDGASGNYTSLFMVALGASDSQVGLLTTLIQALGAMAPLPGAYIAERTHRYRDTILWPSLAARFGYIILFALPLFQIGQPIIAAAIIIYSLRSFLNSLVGAPWTAAMGQMVPISLYQVRVLHFSAATIGMLVSVELATNIVMQRVYGSVFIPRFGDYRVMRTLRLATAVVPLAWLFVTSPLAGALIGLFSGLIWSGHDLANFNGLLEVTPAARRASYIAVHTVTTSLSAAIGPAIGGVLTGVIGYHPLFLASGILRILSAILLLILVRDWATQRPITIRTEGKSIVESR